MMGWGISLWMNWKQKKRRDRSHAKSAPLRELLQILFYGNSALLYTPFSGKKAFPPRSAGPGGFLCLPVDQSLSLWERWHCKAMTERASPSPKSRRAAISCLFVRAILSLRLRFSASVLALSGASRQLSQGESLLTCTIRLHCGGTSGEVPIN